MPQLRFILIWLAVLAGSIGPAAALACNVPVFRYALERWTPDQFVAVLFFRESFAPEQQALLEALGKPAQERAANLLVCKVDVSRHMSPPFEKLWQAQVQPVLPWLVVRYPAQTGIERAVWMSSLNAEAVRTLSDSPTRREVAGHLLNGDTAVWLLLESGNKSQDDAIARMVESESRKLEQTLKLPEADPADPPMNADVPLRIAFSTVRVSRSDAGERLLLAQLVNWDSKLSQITKPMLFPVFGRGRVLPPVVGESIRSDVLEAIGRLLTGPCSCQIKEMNAGYDLLIAANWDGLFEGHELKTAEPPPLTSLSQFVSAATNLSIIPPGVQGVSPTQKPNGTGRVSHNAGTPE
jgi:hypothetical protein